jgi:hypothetical protein
MDIIRLYQDYSINYLTEGHKHCREGWVNTPCPFCSGNEGYHLGFEIENNRYTCWRCGWHPMLPTIAKLLNIEERQARKIVKEYGAFIPTLKIEKAPQKLIEHRLPSNTQPLGRVHKTYLERRKFDPDKIERIWNILATGPVSVLDGINYRHRIVIPFIWNGQQVSFDSRDITGKHMSKYMACPKNREIIPHKHILYGKQEYWKDEIILVEGPTDVWRMGVYSAAVSGIKYTPEQIRCIASSFKRVAVCFDGEQAASLQANKIVAELKFRGVDAFRVDIEGDPGSMDQTEADYLVKQLIK